LIEELLDFAEHEFSISKPDKNGISEREHLEQVERQTGRRPKGLDGPDFPTLLSHIWSAFVALSSGRTMGFSGPNPITYDQIKAWKELTNTPLSSWEVEAIKRVDVIYMGSFNG
jgi:hypothetical protein